jgi:hypothetical protein
MQKKIVTIALFSILLLSIASALTVTTRAATEGEIEQAIKDGLAWLVAQQNNINPADPSYGSWNAYWGQLEAGTGSALYKLCDRAYELKKQNPNIESPFDPDYEYSQNVINGFNWVFDHLAIVDIGIQDHTAGATGTMDNPDTNGNGKGVTTLHWYSSYTTGILLAAIAASGTPDRVVTDPSSPVNGWTYKQVAQDMVDFLAFSQVDPSVDWMGYTVEGGWDYVPINNGSYGTGWQGDQSNSGYAVLGLGEAQAFGCTIPGWVKTELNWWIDWVQDDVNADANDGGSWYSYPGDGIGVNILKTGNLIFEMALVGDTPTTPRVTYATDYLVRHWSDASGSNQPPGWDGTPAEYQTMFCAMKGLEYMGIDTFDSIDWFANFSDAIVAQQDKTPGPTYGSWQHCSGRGDPVIITEWALLTLEKVAPPRLTPGKVTGGGQIAIPLPKGKASFGFNVMYQEGWAAPKGELQYVDHTTKMIVHGPSMISLVVSSDKTKATFVGTCTINGVGGFTFKAYVEDNSEPGTNDVFKISLSNGYTAGGTLLNGNIQIHKKP